MKDDTALTPLEVAEILKISKNTVYELIKRGELNGYKVGKKVRIDRLDVEEYKNSTKNTKAKTAAIPNNEAAYSSGFIISGQDIMLDIMVRHLERCYNGFHALRSYEGSYNGLYKLYQGKVQIATAHLWDGDTGKYNVPYVKRMLPGVPAVVVHLAKRMQGFYIAKGNPKNIQGWEDLKRSDITIINREKGSGTRVLLDEYLRKFNISTSTIKGYDRECSSHLGIASAVSRGEADIGLGNEKSSLQVTDIDFIPLQQEKYELIIKKEDILKPDYQAVLQVINSEEFKRELEGIGGYDLSDMGKISGET
jgi:putative molybdopterin biosynthesis protein